MQCKIVEIEGKLAIDWLTIVDQDKPVIHRYYKVSTIPISSYPDLPGKEVYLESHRVYLGNGKWIRLEYDNWDQICIDFPDARPRDGKEYTWEWIRGKWQRKWFPSCSECRGTHNPALPVCEECGYCHKPTSKCKR